MKKILLTLLALTFMMSGTSFAQQHKSNTDKQTTANPPIYIAFLWHMHQPIYRPGEDVISTDGSGRYSYSVIDIHNSRTGPYTTWPNDAVQKGIAAGLPYLGASVSFSGSLIRNLNQIEAAGRGFGGWKNPWKAMANNKTSNGNYRLDLIGFGYHHPLMGLVEYDDIRHQISEHRKVLTETFGVTYSKGIFPPENAFTPRMIPALVDEGLEWVLVDNVHFERATKGYPYSKSGNLYEPNPADMRNPDPGDWVQLNGLWAPTKISARWGHQPHYVTYTNPETGETNRIIAVPTSRYLGNEDGRGGFGALQYEAVMSQLESFNTDPDHPILIVLHHDGDNFGGGSEGYYGGNFQNFVDWLKANPSRFVGTTIQDYLDMFPVDDNDVIHVEDGSWAGADNGDPEFLKWLGKPGADGYSPDRNSWAILTAVKNLVSTVQENNPSHSGLPQAREMLSNAQASDYWYWDGTEIWDSNPARGGNLALDAIDGAWNNPNETTAPTIFIPQRDAYNPGGFMWEIAQSSEISIWTFVFDASGLARVELKYRIDEDGEHGPANDIYAGGSGVGAWSAVTMNEKVETASITDPLPKFRANRFEVTLTDLQDKLIDYYVEAEDTKGNIRKSPIRSVYIGTGSSNGGGGSGGGGGSATVSWTPTSTVTQNDTIFVTLSSATGAKLHWGVNPVGSTWTTPAEEYRPEGTVVFGSGPAVETPFPVADSEGKRILKLGPFNGAQSVTEIAFVIHFDNDTWDNNGGNDYKIPLSVNNGGGGGSGESGYIDPAFSFTVNGSLDDTAIELAKNGSSTLYAAFNGRDLYVATEVAQGTGNDVFIFVAGSKSALRSAPWAKAGQVAGWSGYIGNEADNNWAGWFDATGSAVAQAGNVLEGVWDLSKAFTTKPDTIYLAVGRYANNDDGALVSQVPAATGEADAIISADEFALLILDKPTETSTESELERPKEISIRNYPNPFNPGTMIRFTLPVQTQVKMEVYDVFGRKVSELANKAFGSGEHAVYFNATGLSSGLYFARMQTPEKQLTLKMMLVK